MKDKFIYQLKQATVIMIGIVWIFGSIWAMQPIVKQHQKMQKIMHNHKIHHQHFYECNCKY
jgi:hypothetical protein